MANKKNMNLNDKKKMTLHEVVKVEENHQSELSTVNDQITDIVMKVKGKDEGKVEFVPVNDQITDLLLEREKEVNLANTDLSPLPAERAPIKKKKDRSNEVEYKPYSYDVNEYDSYDIENKKWIRYTPEERLQIADRILKDRSMFGMAIEEIAVRLNLSKTTLYKWRRHVPEIRHALSLAKERMISEVWGKFKENMVTKGGERFNGGDFIKLMGLMGVNKQIEPLVGEHDEAKALMHIQQALAEGSVDEKYGESCARVVMSKIEAKKELELMRRIEALEARLSN